tara:strand:- start:77 stop:430 length:354 start_codon:yes stop_codon:yes gene_type:complete
VGTLLCLKTSLPSPSINIKVGTSFTPYFSRNDFPSSEWTLTPTTLQIDSNRSLSLLTAGSAAKHASQKSERSSSNMGSLCCSKEFQLLTEFIEELWLLCRTKKLNSKHAIRANKESA